MALDSIPTFDGTKVPSLTRTDPGGAVEVPESVASFDDGSSQPTRVSNSNPLPVLVGGRAASGSAVSGNPVLIGGSDGTNARTIATDTLGNVDITGKALVASGSLTGTGTLFSVDVGDCSHQSTQLTGTFVGTVVWEACNDNTNFVTIGVVRRDTASPVEALSATTTGLYVGAIPARYFRARVSAYTSGTITATAAIRSIPPAPVTQPVQIIVGSGATMQTQPQTSDAVAVNGTALAIFGANELFNGTSWDRFRNNHEVTVLASAARTGNTNSSDLTNFNARGVRLTINVTALTGTPSITAKITGKSTLGNVYTTILQSAAITATGATVLTVYPGITAAANSKADDLIPRLWRVEMTHADAQSITYSVDANYIL